MTMSSNLPADFRETTREHYHECASLCRYQDHEFDERTAIALFISAAVCLAWWGPEMGLRRVHAARRLLTQAMAVIECPAGHRSHECDCEDIARSRDG
jgi:hypothetical protein